MFKPKIPTSDNPPTKPVEVKKEDVKMKDKLDHESNEENFGEKITDSEETRFYKELYDTKKRTSPIKTLEDKWKLLPAFLRVKGLVKQQLDSFNYFIDVELSKILEANKKITIDEYDDFFLEYENIRVLKPNSVESSSGKEKITPHQCRLRDLTYSAPIVVDIRYTKGKEIYRKANVEIGRMPIMLGSNRCILYNLSESQLAKLGECPHDPGGYFIVKGTEKVILIHEQISKNRIILEVNNFNLFKVMNISN